MLFSMLFLSFSAFVLSDNTWNLYISDNDSYKLYENLKPDGSSYWVLYLSSGQTYNYVNVTSITTGRDRTVYISFNDGLSMTLPPYRTYERNVNVLIPPCPTFKLL